MKLPIVVVSLLIIVLLAPFNFSIANPTTVGSSTNPYPTRTPTQRNIFYAHNRFWVFYSNGSAMVYSTSSDGETWTTPTLVADGVNNAEYFSLWFDETYIHYARKADFPATLYYRRGTPNANGTITWSAERQAEDGGDRPFISVDSDGYPFIVFSAFNKPYVTKSSTNDSTWTTASGFPKMLKDDIKPEWHCSIVPLTSNQMLAIYSGYDNDYNARTYSRLWNTTDWETEQEVTSSSFNSTIHSAVSIGNVVHLVTTTTKELSPTRRVSNVTYFNWTGSWSSAMTIKQSVNWNTRPVITKSGNNLVINWVEGGTFYLKFLGAFSSRFTWFSSSGAEPQTLTTLYEQLDNEYGVIWTDSSYNVRFNCFTYSAVAGSYTIYNTASTCPILEASWDEQSKTLTFSTIGNVTITGVKDNPLWITDDDVYLTDWSWIGNNNITLTNVDGIIKVQWKSEHKVGSSGSTTSIKEKEEGTTWTRPQIDQFGVYLIISAVGLVSVGGIVATIRKPKVSRRPSGKGRYRSRQPRGHNGRFTRRR